MNNKQILTALAGGTKTEKAAALAMVSSEKKPVLITQDGHVLANYTPPPGTTPALCVVDDI